MSDRLLVMEDQLLLAAVMAFAYGTGFAALRLIPGLLLPARATPRWTSAALIGLPLLLCITFEWATGLWDGRPGAMGTGSLQVAEPMLLAGAAAGVAFLSLRALAPSERRNATAVWMIAVAALSALALSLWRFWPAPHPAALLIQASQRRSAEAS